MFTIDNPPTYESYLEAFRSLPLSALDHKVLQIHYDRPGRRITSQQLTAALGYTGIATSNSFYGRLAHKVADVVHFDTTHPERQNGRLRYWRAIATGDYTEENFTWILRPEVARALETLDLVDQTGSLAPPIIDIDVHPKLFTAVEGRRLLVLHLERERNSSLRHSKIHVANSLDCEICGFSFLQHYGLAAAEYCEVHHLIPLAQLDGQNSTRLEDLAIVCANCHRVIHLRNPPYTLDEVREMSRVAREEQTPVVLRNSAIQHEFRSES